MAYQLKSNPLDNNPLFSSAAPEENAQKPAQKPGKKPRSTSGRQAKQPKAESAKAAPAAKKQEEPQRKSAQDQADYTRATFIVRRDLLEQLKDYAFTERREIKEVINEILASALDEIKAEYQKDGRSFLSRTDTAQS